MIETDINNETPFTKDGYKQTKLGLIPKDWSVVTFKDIADKKVKWSITGGPFGSDLKAEHYKEEGIRIIQLQNIGDGKFRDKSKIFTSVEKADQLVACNIFPGEIILSKMGDPVARACKIPNTEKRWLMGSDGIRLVIDESQYDKRFVLDYINYSIFRKLAISRSTGSTRRRIGLVDLKKIPFVKIPLLEQQKIANILCTWDKAIAAQERLISEKQKLKNGLMQQLLTGKKRFAGFEQEWEEKKLKDIATFRRGSFPQPYGLDKWYDDNGMPFVQVYDVSNNMTLKSTTKRKISVLAQEQSVFAQKGTVVLTIQGSIGRIAITQYDAFIDRTLLIFQEYKEPIDKSYFVYVVQLLFDREKERAPGGTIKTITKEVLKNFKLKLPRLVEQRKISLALDSAESELIKLKKSMISLKRQKRGLMQQLLTGEKRVKI